MEAGYDYLLLRGRPQRRFLNFSGIFLFVLGAMLLATSGAYYGYTAKVRADLDSMNVTFPGPASGAVEVIGQQSDIQSQAAGDARGAAAASTPGPERESPRMVTLDQAGESPSPAIPWSVRRSAGASGESAGGSAPAGANPAAAAGAPAALPGQSGLAGGAASPSRVFPVSAIGSQQLFPGGSLQPTFWGDPLSYESAAYRQRALLRGFTPVDLSQGLLVGSGSEATRLIVPSIEVDSRVAELAILDLGGSRAYETPDNTVGHIPETANAGESGSAWFFGHTETPILGEGSVFFNLRRIPGMLRDGQDVFVVTDNGEHRYLYRITSSRVVHQRDMSLIDTGRATIHLVACVPRLVYDHRLIVNGELIGQK